MAGPIFIFYSKSSDCPLPFPASAMRDLSNFSDFDVEYEGNVYSTVEHAYQALKYSCTTHPELVLLIRDEFSTKTAIQAKSSGSKKEMKKRGVTLDLLRWNECSLRIMTSLVASKIKRHVELQHILTKAKEYKLYLVHFSRMDMYWGAHTNSEKTIITKGANHLGEIYMSFYKEL
jgi:ribA/ribD-fused uncharacterized protein